MQTKIVNLGILVASIRHRGLDSSSEPIMPEPIFYRELSMAGKRLDIDVYIFTSEGLAHHSDRLFGYRLVNEQFVKQLVPFPDIVYDRCFFTDVRQRINSSQMLNALSRKKKFQLLNGALPSKLEVYDALREVSLLTRHLPLTLPLLSPEQSLDLADHYEKGVILKPSSGMQGRGIIHVKRCAYEQTTIVNGRTRTNQSFTATFNEDTAYKDWLSRHVNKASYLIQPYLELNDNDNKPFDLRVLIQKDEKSNWKISGVAVRTGQAGSVTSNLHGGGDAAGASLLLSTKYGEPKAERLLEMIHTISKQTAERLESKFGRLAELGLDYGIDQSGRLWLLEANSKPGRSSFRIISDQKAERLSVERPLLYARLLSRRLSPSFVANEFANGRRHYSSTDNQIRPFNVQEVHR